MTCEEFDECGEPVVARALIRMTREAGDEEVVVTYVCDEHATTGDIPLDHLPALAMETR